MIYSACAHQNIQPQRLHVHSLHLRIYHYPSTPYPAYQLTKDSLTARSAYWTMSAAIAMTTTIKHEASTASLKLHGEPKPHPVMRRMLPPSSAAHESMRASSSSFGHGDRAGPKPSPKLHLGMFEIGKPLGKGKFGRVYLARHRTSGYVCALKVLNKEEISRDGAQKHIRREIEVQSNLRHPGCLGFYGWFHDSRRIFLILEFAPGGELYKVLRKQRRFAPRQAARYCVQVAQALDYLHSKNIMHRDLKPENLLIGLHGELKLADFGYSVHAPSDRRETLCGTLDYLPPEMLTSGKSKAYTRAVDQWTLGVLTYELLTGEAPFEDSQVMTHRRIVKCDMKPLPSSLPQEARDFVHSVCCCHHH